jgi:hypothetical protein
MRKGGVTRGHLLVGVQWLHVLLGVLWFGNALVLAVIVIPALSRLPIVTQRAIGSQIGIRSNQVLRIVVPLIIVLGFVRGTLFGPIKSVDFLVGTAYGWTWLVSLAMTILLYVWGERVLIPSVRAMDEAPPAANGTATAELAAAPNRVKGLVLVELLAVLVIFSCMILMRFGL